MNNSGYSPSFFRFEDLRVYQKALDYFIWVQTNTETISNAEKNHLIRGFSETALNISAKIAEGSSKSKSQFVFHLKEAKTAIRQCVMFTSACVKLEYFNAEEEEISRNYLMELTKMLGALIGSIQRDNPASNPSNRTGFDDDDDDDSPNSY